MMIFDRHQFGDRSLHVGDGPGGVNVNFGAADAIAAWILIKAPKDLRALAKQEAFESQDPPQASISCQMTRTAKGLPLR